MAWRLHAGSLLVDSHPRLAHQYAAPKPGLSTSHEHFRYRTSVPSYSFLTVSTFTPYHPAQASGAACPITIDGLKCRRDHANSSFFPLFSFCDSCYVYSSSFPSPHPART